MQNSFHFDESQFNNLFPFYILINSDLSIESCGRSLKKIYGDIDNLVFTQCIVIKRPNIEINDFEDLKNIKNTLVVLETQKEPKLSLRGQLEFIEKTNQLIYIGSPWLGSMDQIHDIGLTIPDFAFHDPLIDLLHVLKTQELTTNELKVLLAQVNEQRKLLKTQEEKYRNIIANMNLGLLEVDLEENILYSNQSFCEMIGLPLEEIVGQKTYTLFNDEAINKVIDEKKASRKIGVSDTYELCIKNKKGDIKYWLVSGAPKFDDNNNQVGSIGIHLDITKQKRLEKDLLKAKLDAENAQKAEQQFLANMSHEIRTPLNSIIGMSHLLKDTVLAPDQKEYINLLLNASELLHNLISDLLDISKIDSGNIEVHKKDFNIIETIENIASTFQYKIETKNVEFQYTIDRNVPELVHGDELMLNQALFNLLGNASKFTDKGKINLIVSLDKKIENEAYIKIQVTDTGIGIAPNELALVFQKFKQASNNYDTQKQGTGLGLAITKQIIELQKGSIEVESTLNQGTTFTIILPYGVITKTSELISDKISYDENLLKGLKVLIVDDNIMNVKYAKTLLDKWKSISDIAYNGLEAFEKCKENQYDVVIMDLRMPIMNGYESTRKIRNNGLNKTSLIIGLSASALGNLRQASIDAGMNDYIHKPYKPNQLKECLLKNITMSVDDVIETQNTTDYQYPKGLDANVLNETYSGDTEQMEIIFDLFINDTVNEFEKIIDAIKVRDNKTGREISHKLKPVFTMVGIPEITQQMQQMETKLSVAVEDWSIIDDEIEKIYNKLHNFYLPAIVKEHKKLNELNNIIK